MKNQLQIIPTNLLEEYLNQVPSTLQEIFDTLKDAEISTVNFNFYVSVSSVFSSKIEGEIIDLDSYVKHKKFGIEFLPDYTKKIDDLYNAYIYGKNNELNPDNVSLAHKLLSKHLVATNWQGKFRNQNMFVTTSDGKIEYVATSSFEVENEMKKFFNDVSILIKQELSIEEVFYYASFIHLVFVNIHPFSDGNGRISRLLEKWFLAEKLGQRAWFIKSETNYYKNVNDYYKNLARLGLFYDALDYKKSIPFLLMLPQSFIFEK